MSGLRALLALVLLAPAGAADLAGVVVPGRVRLGGSELVLNGAGLRKRAFFKVYVVSLYLVEKRKAPAEVLALAGPKRLSLTLLRTVPTRRLVEALNGGIGQNSTAAERQALQDRIAALSARLLALGQAGEGDVLSFDWLPAAGTVVVLNGTPCGAAIPGEDLYRALLKIWLGDRPTNAGLKRALLGDAG